MDKLLPYYEQELSKLRQASHTFADRHPQLAARLELSGETSADPEVERLIQSVALLNARTASHIDDQHADLTSSLLTEHQSLRSIPSCAIAQIDFGNARPNTISNTTRIPRGTMLKSPGSTPCKFRTAYDIHIAPITISDARIAPIDVPAVLRLPPNAAASLRVTIESTSSSKLLQSDEPLRVHISGAPAQAAAIMDMILLRTLCVCVQLDEQWTLLPTSPFCQAGMSEAEALLPETSAASCYRLLTEYFCFPEKFNFIDIDLDAITSLAPRSHRLTLHLILPDYPHPRALSRDNLRLGCTPIINLFPHRASPIKLDPSATEYTLTPDQLPEVACEIYSIDKVSLLRRASGDGRAPEFAPFDMPSPGNIHWSATSSGSGYEHALSLVERSCTPARLGSGTLAVHLTCSNRNLPKSLTCGAKGGDLATEINTAGLPIYLLEKPTATQHVAAHNAHWPLIASLTRAPTLPT
ncbi:type VI secretion system baseplate subunit TssF [Pseudoduganella sp. UC29_106]|uniref:type VI secretion system baseplate subunit TssF n=1 Tax=Pseudoduganella sp. UC29_106 TaxID=3374553 RepID=UPI0037563563